MGYLPPVYLPLWLDLSSLIMLLSDCCQELLSICNSVWAKGSFYLPCWFNNNMTVMSTHHHTHENTDMEKLIHIFGSNVSSVLYCKYCLGQEAKDMVLLWSSKRQTIWTHSSFKNAGIAEYVSAELGILTHVLTNLSADVYLVSNDIPQAMFSHFCPHCQFYVLVKCRIYLKSILFFKWAYSRVALWVTLYNNASSNSDINIWLTVKTKTPKQIEITEEVYMIL